MTKPITFVLDWVASAQFAGLYWARDKGLYEEVGLHVKLEPWAHDDRSVIAKLAEVAASGKLCAGCLEDNLIVQQAAADGSVIAFGAMLQDTPMVLMSPSARPIQQIADLRGKRIAMHTDGIRILELVLSLEGITNDEVELHEVGFDLEHLRQGRFDALQGYLMTEPIQLASLGFDVETLAIKHRNLLPYAQVYFTERSLIEQHGATFNQFLEASSNGWKAVCADPDEAAQLMANAIGEPSQAEQQRAMLERVIPLVTGNLPPDAVGQIDTRQWRRNLVTYSDFGLIDRPMDLGDVVVNLAANR